MRGTQEAGFKAWISGEEGTALDIGDVGITFTEEKMLDYAMLTFA